MDRAAGDVPFVGSVLLAARLPGARLGGWPPLPAACRRQRRLAVLAAAVRLQVLDLQGAHATRRQTARDPRSTRGRNPSCRREWTHLRRALSPPGAGAPAAVRAAPVPYEPAVRLAADHGLTVNAGVIARGDEARAGATAHELDRQLEAGAARPRLDLRRRRRQAGRPRAGRQGRATCRPIDDGVHARDDAPSGDQARAAIAWSWVVGGDGRRAGGDESSVSFQGVVTTSASAEPRLAAR